MLAIIAGVSIKGGSTLFRRRRRVGLSTSVRGCELIATLACMAYLSADAVIAFRGQMLSRWAFSNQIFGKSPFTASGVMFLFGHFGFLSRLSEGFNQCVRIFIDDERGDRVVEGLLECSWSSFPMNA